MPSYLHELLLLLFRNHCRSAADLLRQLDVQLPEYDEVRAESSDLSNLQPAEHRADLVLLLVRGSQKVLVGQSADIPLAARVASAAIFAQSDFARRYVAQGKAEGRVELILELLALRFGLLDDAVQTHVRRAQDAQLDAVAERVLTAQTLDEALGPLS
jgi:hypothetical protein